MRANLTYECGCLLTLDLEPWSQTPEGKVRACHVHRGPAGEAGRPARRQLALTYFEEGGSE